MGDTQTSRTPPGADQPHDAATTNIQPAVVPDHVVVVEVDDDDNTSDISARSVHSSTTSVTSSVFEYRVENGRTYHGYKEGNLQHNLFLLTFNDKLGTAPINTNGAGIGRVLDVGTGTGIWAIDFGEEHPEAENCFDNLAPGGYLELNEMDLVPLSDDGTLKPDSKIIKAVTLLQEALVTIGRQFQIISDLKTVMIEQGFTDVTLQKFKWPLNPWPILGWTKEEVLGFMAEVRKEMNDMSIHAYMPIWSVYGKKPEQEPEDAAGGQ
ncbi:methyltransferase domain-containing protein [Colletotrichum sojae]|uniref:Methyltransferase domain-containing protein n=1 Tax=Colletotrichum sojae TaxID=2175907 RepID=A0A8H6IW41_9PEZI|nr:methyltransferase domain-containing protein [Colletotrichum sojae]